MSHDTQKVKTQLLKKIKTNWFNISSKEEPIKLVAFRDIFIFQLYYLRVRYFHYPALNQLLLKSY